MSADPIASCLPAIAAHLEAVRPAVGGAMTGLRERDLASAVHAELARHLETTVVATVMPLPSWPRLGRSGTDFVAQDPPGSRSFRHVGELKWCQVGLDKIVEAIWDLFKMALAVRDADVQTAHLITGAPEQMWPNAFCADLFLGGVFTPEELCSRRFAGGRKRLAWDYMLDGGYDRYPDVVPTRITTIPVREPIRVGADGNPVWELRAIRVESSGDDVPFPGGWPNGSRPPDADHPKLSEGE